MWFPLSAPIRRFRGWFNAFIFGLAVTLVSGCAGLSETPPAGFNLTGTWELNAALSDSPALAGIASQQGRGIGVPILQLDRIVIEQNQESLGMAFKGAPYRDVSWGKRVRRELTINAGWQDDELHINTKGGRLPIRERYALSEDGGQLTVFVELNGGKNDLVFRRVFDHQTPTVESSSDWLDEPDA